MSSFEEMLKKKSTELDELKLVTTFLSNKDALLEQLLQAKVDMASITKSVGIARQDLETMKAQNIELRNLVSMLEKMDKDFVRMSKYLTAEFIDDLTNLGTSESPCVKNFNNSPLNSVNRETNRNHLANGTLSMEPATPETQIQDCKKTLFKNSEDSYVMDLLSNEEFSKIPKYIIGRQSLAALNNLVTVINQILEGKYKLLSMGKNEARKKGKLDLYLSLKRDEIVVAPGEDPLYFFTAEDYYRQTQTKLDKTKLNLLTALRHCKRLRELRTGKTLQYVLITSSERSRD